MDCPEFKTNDVFFTQLTLFFVLLLCCCCCGQWVISDNNNGEWRWKMCIYTYIFSFNRHLSCTLHVLLALRSQFMDSWHGQQMICWLISDLQQSLYDVLRTYFFRRYCSVVSWSLMTENWEYCYGTHHRARTLCNWTVTVFRQHRERTEYTGHSDSVRLPLLTPDVMDTYLLI